MNRLRTRSRAGGGGATYTAQGRDFDGTNDYATRGSALTGIADGKTGLLSLWFRKDGGDGAEQRLLNMRVGASTRFTARLTSGNALNVLGTNAAGSTILSNSSSTTYMAGATWRHVLLSWDLAAGIGRMYVQDADVKSGAGTQTDDAIKYAGDDCSIGASPAFTEKLNGCLSEIWFNTEYLDISVEANRRKFISAAGKPTNLGANGSTPTGNQPLIYMPAGDPSDNKGTGGNFTITGALDVASTSPSD